MNRTARLDGTHDTDRAAPQNVWLPKGLTASDLLGMRETGMTNAAIGRAADITAATVEKLIGKTPPELVRAAKSSAGQKSGATRRGKRHTKAAPASTTTPAPGAKVTRYGSLKATVASMRLEGGLCHYNVMPGTQTVEVINQSGRALNGKLAFKDVEAFIEELLNVTTAIESIG